MNNEYLFLSGSNPDARDKESAGSRNDARKVHRGGLYFFLAPTYSSTVLVEMVVVVLVESEDCT